MTNEHPRFRRMEDMWTYVEKQAQKRVQKINPGNEKCGTAPNPRFGAPAGI